MPDLFLKYIVPVVLILEVFLVLLAFEAKSFSFPKIRTRHSVKRIMVVGFIIGSLLVSFFTPYFNMIGKYRDLPPGEITPMDTNPSWFDSLFTGEAPFFIDGILDLLDNMDIDPDLDIDEIAQVEALSGTLGNYLYRWDVRDNYQASSWDFIETSGETRFDLTAENNDPAVHSDPPSSYQQLDVTQLVYSVQTALLTQLISTWSNNYNEPFLTNDLNWTDNLVDENGTVCAVEGTADVKYNLNAMLSLKATTNQIGFIGEFNYQPYFVSDDNISDIISDSTNYDDYTYLHTSWYNSTFARFLQKPLNYETISPLVAAYAAEAAYYGITNGHTMYQQTTYILEKILSDYGMPTADNDDNNGRDRAELLLEGSDTSASAYIALAIMTLRLNNIPCRPVIGFAIGDGTAIVRTLSLSDNIYAWVEALLPIDDGVGGPTYKWGQFQMGPYVDLDTSSMYYCENTLYSSFNVSIEMLGEPVMYLPVTRQDIGGEDVYLTDYAKNYTLRATVSDETGFVEGATVNFATVTVVQLQTYSTNPAGLLSVANNLGTAISVVGGVAELYTEWDPLSYNVYNPSNPGGTAYVLLAYVTLLSTNYTGFVVIPTGYLSIISINSTIDVGLDPSPPPAGLQIYYLIQKGVQYQITTELFEDPAQTIPLEDRLVTYYILDENEKTDLLLGTLDPATLRVLGTEFTDPAGNSSVYTMQGSTNIFSTLTPPVPVGDIYYLVASYGQNYTYTQILYFDGKYSTVDSSDYYHNQGVDGDIFAPDVDIYLYQKPPGGLPSPLIGENVEVWLVRQSVYDAANKTDTTTLRADLVVERDLGVLYGANDLSLGPSDLDGFYNITLNVDVTHYGPGFYRLVVFYLDTWNISASITIAFPPAHMSYALTNIKSSISSQVLMTYSITDIGISGMLSGRNNEYLSEINYFTILYTKDVKH
ncbi:MAG: transglutaminase domain-containing protein [Candidatus Heimdallarchaeaceae archaeon]